MTEEIIIDGVDVAGCCLYLKSNGKCLRLLTDNEPETECNAICDYGCLYHKEQLKRLQETLKHIENGRKEKANKLKRIEEIVTHCIQGGFTDEFIQEIFDICREYEEV